MSWNGHIVVDMDAHIRERADRFYLDYLDPAYRAPYQLLCEAVAQQEKKGERYALFGSRTAIVEQLETGRPLGVRDTFGLSGRSEMEHGRIAFPPGRHDPLPPIRQEVNWDIKARIEDMDRASVDIGVLFPTHVSSYCALARRRVRERALPRLSPLGRRFLRPGADPAQMDRRRQHARRCRRRRRDQILGRARPQPRRGLRLAASAGRQAARQPRPLPALRRGADRSTCRSSRMAARRGRPTGPAPSTSTAPGSCCTPSATRGPAWRRWAR